MTFFVANTSGFVAAESATGTLLTARTGCERYHPITQSQSAQDTYRPIENEPVCLTIENDPV